MLERPAMRSTAVRLVTFLLTVLFVLALAPPLQAAKDNKYRIAVLMVGQVRNAPLQGMKDGLQAIGLVEGKEISLDIMNANGDRKKLSQLAQTIIAAKPDVAVAAGGVEADALQAASKGSGVPVVFLAVASAVNRGLAASMKSSGNNMTGIETNDTALTAKRLWVITKLLPRAKKVCLFLVPDITPSRNSVKIAREVAPKLGLQLSVVTVRTAQDVLDASKNFTSRSADVVLINPVATVWQAMKGGLFVILEAKSIPIMGVNQGDLAKGAFAFYGGTRYEAGFQAARLIKKILKGAQPSAIPLETPSKLQLVINKWVIQRMRLNIPQNGWAMANRVVSEKIK